MNDLSKNIQQKTVAVTQSLYELKKKKYVLDISKETYHKYDHTWKVYGFHIYVLFSFIIKNFEDIFYSHNLKLLKNMYSFSKDCVEHYFVIPPRVKYEKSTKKYMDIYLEKIKEYRNLYSCKKTTNLILKIYKNFGLPLVIPFEIKQHIVQFLYKW
tara:strand:- start:13548 stop:14015 length:468 start_codon:yes stop_codon:yes gene_type:complete